MKKMLTIIIAMVFCNCATSAFAEYPEVTIEPFPIMSWISPGLNQEQIRLFKECGFTVISIKPTETEFGQMKKYWNGNYFLADFAMKDFTSQLIDKLVAFHSDDPNKIGYFIGDEPSAKKFPAFKETFDKFRAKDSKRICFLNALPNVHNESVLGAGDYLDYLESYFKYLAPRYCSYDYYPCFWFNIDSAGYYENIEEMRHYSLKNRSKMLAFVQSFDNRENRSVSESDMAWQVYSQLAYGAKGLWYFYYAHPLHLSDWQVGVNPRVVEYNSVGNYGTYPMEYQEYYRKGYNLGLGILDFNDNPTPLYYYAKKINNEVLKWSPILDKLTSTRVRHTGNFADMFFKPGGTQTVVSWAPNKYEYIYAVQAADLRLDKGFVLGFFEDPNARPYVMIVNKRHGEFQNRERAKVDAVMTFKNSVKQAFIISNTTGREKPFAIDANKQARIGMDGGSAVLLRLVVDPNVEN